MIFSLYNVEYIEQSLTPMTNDYAKNFVVIQNGKSDPNVENCVKCYSPNQCGICSDGFNVENGECVLIQDSSSQEGYNIDHCEYYKTQFECESCVNGYYLDNNECKQKAICDVDNCKECKNTDSYKCEECNEGYHLYEGECISNECQVNNCYKCIESSSMICDECNYGYEKKNEKCVPECQVFLG